MYDDNDTWNILIYCQSLKKLMSILQKKIVYPRCAGCNYIQIWLSIEILEDD